MHARMEDYQFTVDWFGGHIPNWQSWLGHLAGRPNVKILEIGSYEGRATVWLLGNILTHSTARIDCLDIFSPFAAPWLHPGETDDYEKRFDHNIKTALAGAKVKKIKSHSHEALRKLEFNRYDAIYIDGSHATPDVLEDGVLSFRLLKVGGIMIFDDYEWNAYSDPIQLPRAGIDFFLSAFQRQYDLLYKGYQVAIKKKC